MDDIFVYLIDMPSKTKEAVIPCSDGYTVYIDNKLCEEAQYAAFDHAMNHIIRHDFEKGDIQEIEWETHKGGI